MHHCSLLLVSNAFISPAVKSEAFIIVSMGTPSDSRLEAIASLAFLSALCSALCVFLLFRRLYGVNDVAVGVNAVLIRLQLLRGYVSFCHIYAMLYRVSILQGYDFIC